MISVIIAGGKINPNIIQNIKKQLTYISHSELIIVTDRKITDDTIVSLQLSKDHGFSKMAMFGSLFSKNPYIMFFRDTEHISDDYIRKLLDNMRKDTFASTSDSSLRSRIGINPSGTVMRKDVFFRLGGFSTKIHDTILSAIPVSEKIKKRRLDIQICEDISIKTHYRKIHPFFYSSDLVRTRLVYSGKNRLRIYADIAKDIFTKKETTLSKLGKIYGIIQ